MRTVVEGGVMISRLAAVFLAVCFAAAAHAQPAVLASLPGSGCVPSDATTKFTRHQVNNASVQHTPGNIDLIVLSCPIAPFDSANTDWVVRLVYQDSTGTSTSAFVRARLFRMAIIIPGSPILLATVSSNSSAVTTTNAVQSAAFNHTFDFAQYVY